MSVVPMVRDFLAAKALTEMYAHSMDWYGLTKEEHMECSIMEWIDILTEMSCKWIGIMTFSYHFQMELIDMDWKHVMIWKTMALSNIKE
jgi:hypothetical protein